MFNAANCIGFEAADYLEQLGYTYTVIGVYVGPEVDEEAVFDDRNPNHSELLEEYHEHLITCLEYTEDKGDGEILIEWSEGTVRSHNRWKLYNSYCESCTNAGIQFARFGPSPNGIFAQGGQPAQNDDYKNVKWYIGAK